MIGRGVLINAAAIIAGGIIGQLFGQHIKERTQETLSRTCGLATMFIGVAGAMEGMLEAEGVAIISRNTTFVVISLVLGALLGEWADIEGKFEALGEWLKEKSKSSKDPLFIEGFLTASLTVCIGAMAIIGAIEDGINHDYTILLTKAILDFIIVMVMASSLGKGCTFSAVPVFLWEGLLTVLASFIRPVMTEAALFNISLVGSILIFAVGVNLLFDKKIRVANLLPAVLIAVVAAFL